MANRPGSRPIDRPLGLLFVADHCPYAQRARIAAAALGLDVDLRVIDLDAPPADLLAVEPRGRVPVWVEGHDRVLVESLVIVRYLIERFAPAPRDGGHDAAWCTATEGVLIAALDAALGAQYRWLVALVQAPDDAATEALTDGLASHWRDLDGHLGRWSAACAQASAPRPTDDPRATLAVAAVAAPLLRRQALIERAIRDAGLDLDLPPRSPTLERWTTQLGAWPAAECVDAAATEHALVRHLAHHLNPHRDPLARSETGEIPTTLRDLFAWRAT